MPDAAPGNLFWSGIFDMISKTVQAGIISAAQNHELHTQNINWTPLVSSISQTVHESIGAVLVEQSSSKRSKRRGKEPELNVDSDESDDDSMRPRYTSQPRKHGPRAKADNVRNVSTSPIVHVQHSDVEQSLLREFLQNKGLNQSAKLRIAPSHLVKAFTEDNNGGPSAETPEFDWFSPFTSPWNRELLFLLATVFKAILSKTSGLINEKWGNIPWLIKLIAKRLERVRTAYKNDLPPPPGSSESEDQKKLRIKQREERRLKNLRRNTRRKGTFDRRRDIIRERFNEDPGFWRQLKAIHEELGEAGMSSDDTETEEQGLSPKTVRRIPKVWINPAVSSLWESVEKIGRSSTSPHAGNSKCPRIFSGSMTTSTHTKAIPKLPSNFYDELWWKSQTRSDQVLLDRRPERALPQTVWCHPYLTILRIDTLTTAEGYCIGASFVGY
ncbi:hypothetical protein Hypma_015652 [Hypsizygus marmoreus]|uniref:Uncharacterized protein n=1 Tax=Hypsizygus marmoreus TaxID=39966 RepID=A0A369K555_HYPMA|nr:hypothetical protein Hypma_015652 [Hypsizygus marmoreus]